MRHFGEILTAMVTPLKASLAVDYDKAVTLARHLTETGGSDGLVVCGTTGESPTLTTEEKIRLFEVIREAVRGEAFVVAGTGSNNTAATLRLTRAAEAAGVDGIMLVTPYYNKPPQRALYHHFKDVAAATELPVMLYNVPGRTGCNIDPKTVQQLAEVDNIVAVKEASGDLDQVSWLAAKTDLAVYSGDDSLTLPVLSVGGRGIVSVASHVAGNGIREMIEAYASGKTSVASDIHQRLFPLFKALFITTNPIPVKAALRLTGFDAGSLRLPLVEATDEEVTIIKQAMIKAGILE